MFTSTNTLNKSFKERHADWFVFLCRTIHCDGDKIIKITLKKHSLADQTVLELLITNSYL